jgi:uncharacterized membrane protein YoaK (UPF0700 family)
MATSGDGPQARDQPPAAPAAATPQARQAPAGDKLPHLHLLGILMGLTLVSGMVDAVCYLGLGRVFTANMTGNVVILGFAAAGAPGFSVTASLTSLGLFLAGAVAGGSISKHISPRSRGLAVAIWSETLFVGAAAVVAFLATTVGSGWGRYAVIAILAFAMGIRNSVIHHLAVPDMTTTVLTQTLTGLASDSFFAGGQNTRAGRRISAVAAMLAGAAVGAVLYLHQGAGVPLAVSAATAAAAAILLRFTRAVNYVDKS